MHSEVKIQTQTFDITEVLSQRDEHIYFILDGAVAQHPFSDAWNQILLAQKPFELLPMAPDPAFTHNGLPPKDGEMWYFKQGQFSKL